MGSRENPRHKGKPVAVLFFNEPRDKSHSTSSALRPRINGTLPITSLGVLLSCSAANKAFDSNPGLLFGSIHNRPKVDEGGLRLELFPMDFMPRKVNSKNARQAELRNLSKYHQGHYLLPGMLLYEYRIPLPFTAAEYQIGQLFSVSEMSLRATGGGEGVEVLENEPFKEKTFRLPGYSTGYYTYKIYHMESKIPGFIKLLMEPGKFDVHEKAWNAFPYCFTHLTNPGYMKKNFFIDIESIHIGNDKGLTENALNLSEEELNIRKVVYIDIGNDPLTGKSDILNDPSVFKGVKSGRGPLRGNWIDEANPVMTAYKLVRTEFKWFGLQRKVEQLIQMNEHRLFTQFHRQLFCWSDMWLNKSMKDIRKIELDVDDQLKSRLQVPKQKTSGYIPADLYEGISSYVTNK